jgi:uncharacterized protein (DUF488 family)
MKLFTIGSTQKSAETFFELLNTNKVQKLIDIRLKPDGQLAGFAKKNDLPYFLSNLAAGCQYEHAPNLAPTKEILQDYRADGNWGLYVDRFEKLMDERGIPDNLDRTKFESFSCCLLCSEASPEKCHRRLLAERIKEHWGDVEILHL